MKKGNKIRLKREEFNILVHSGGGGGGGDNPSTPPKDVKVDPWKEKEDGNDDEKENPQNPQKPEKGDGSEGGGRVKLTKDDIIDITEMTGDDGTIGGLINPSEELNAHNIPVMDGILEKSTPQTPKEVSERAQQNIERSLAGEPGNEAGKIYRQMTLHQKLENPNMWKQLLRNFIKSFIKPESMVVWDDEFAGMANAPDSYVPHRRTEEIIGKKPVIQNAVFVLDTSGSISTEDLNVFCTHLVSIITALKDVDFKDIYVLGCDHDIDTEAIYYFKDQKEFKNLVDKGIRAAGASSGNKSVGIDLKGGGGTRFSPPFKWMHDFLKPKGKKIPFVVYFTDLASNDFPSNDLLAKLNLRSNIFWAVFFNEYSSKEDLESALKSQGVGGRIVRLSPKSLEK